MKALISILEPREQGYRVAQVEPEVIFNNTSEIYWVDCPDYVIADKYWYSLADNTFTLIPEVSPTQSPKVGITDTIQTL